MAFLKANDMEAYLRLAQDAKSNRLEQLLASTDACLRALSTRLRHVTKGLVARRPDNETQPDAETGGEVIPSLHSQAYF